MYVLVEGKYLLDGGCCLVSRLDLLLRWEGMAAFRVLNHGCQVTGQPSGSGGCRPLFTSTKAELWTVSAQYSSCYQSAEPYSVTTFAREALGYAVRHLRDGQVNKITSAGIFLFMLS